MFPELTHNAVFNVSGSYFSVSNLRVVVEVLGSLEDMKNNIDKNIYI